MEQTIYKQIVAPVVNILTGYITKHMGYVISSSKHVTHLKNNLKDLEKTKDNVRNKRKRNNREHKEIPDGVDAWVNDVEAFMKAVESISSEGYGCLNIKTRHQAGKNACEALQRIQRFIDEHDKFEWSDASIPTGRPDSNTETSSHGVMFKCRDEQFNKALKWLQEDNNKSQVIALCGMPGIGKTTMMEQLETKAINQKMFGYIVPVVIGETPKMHSIQNDIALRLTSKKLEEETESERAASLCRQFKTILEGEKERILVTLDNVWPGKFELSKIGLTCPLPNGLKLLLTSRYSDICEQIEINAHSVHVEVNDLEKQEAEDFFFRNTNVSKEDTELYATGCEIVKRCGYLPLAINIIGKHLHSKEQYLWKTTLLRLDARDHNLNVHKAIKVSYDYIPQVDKEVLLLCGLFPDDSNTQIEVLTRYAWGLNLFNGVSTLVDVRNWIRTCVSNLKNANLLINNDDIVGCVKMHDLVRDCVLGVVSKSDRSWIIKHGNVTQLARRDESCKRISLTCKGMSEFPKIFEYPNLSLLQLMDGDSSLEFPEDFYKYMKKLQVIAYYDMKSPLMISRSLHCSTNLKSLCLYRCKLMFDFTFVGDLVNLEVLSFACCGIDKLPSAIGKLVKLKLLDLTGCENLRIDNGVFKNLKNLEELYMIFVLITESNIKELAMLSKQLFALEVEFVEKENLFEFFSFEKLDKFKIAIGDYFDSSQLEKDPFVNKLKLVSDCWSDIHDCKINKLFKKTEHLELLVKDMIDLEDFRYDQHSFSCLKELEVFNCSNLKYLFPVCVANGLKKLEKLIIRKCPVLEALIQNGGSEINGVVELPQLLKLDLYDLPNFTSIYPDSSSSMCALFNNQPKFPKLEKLKIRLMEKLKQIWGCEFGSSEKEEVNNFSMLREIEVEKCDSLVNLFPSNPMRLLTHLESLVVAKCGSIKELFNIDLECIGHEVDNNFSMLREIEVKKCDSLVNLFPINTMRLLTHLERLHVRSCSSIKELFNIDLECNGHEVENNFSMLREIEVEGCDSLVNLFPSNPMRLLTHLEKLHVRSCSSIKELFNINLECVGHEVENNISMLREIIVVRCISLVNLFPTIPIRLLTNLESLHFSCRIDLESDDNIHKVLFEIDLNNQQPLFPNLKTLHLLYMKDMSHVWKCNNWNKYLLISYSSFHSLTSITIYYCNRIKYLFSPLMAKLLSNLHTIRIDECREMEEVVSNRDDDDDDNDEEEMSSTYTTTTFFPHLQSLTFEDLTNLKRIGGGGGGQSKGTKTNVIHDQLKVSHVGVVSWSLCQFSKEINISSCDGLSSVIPLDAIGQMQKLEVLTVKYCKSLKELFESQYINGNSGDSKSSININEGSVDIDAISRQSNINMTRLSNLKKLVIISCNLLQHVFTFSMLESLKHLEELIIKYCETMKVIVEKENVEQTEDVVFPRLKFLTLESLPNLEGFFLGMNDFKWPLLEKVKIIECPQMMNFTCGQSTTRVLRGIHTNLGRHSLECGLNFHHLKIHQTRLESSESRSSCCNSLPAWSFHNLIDLQMKYDYEVKCIIPSNELLQLQKLETIDVYDCKLVEEVFEVEGANEGTNSESKIVVEIPNLRQVGLIGLESLKYIWKSNQRRVLKFPNLTTLSIRSCGSLKHVFTSSIVGSLLQLQDLDVGDCDKMEVIVKIEEEDEVKEEMELFPCLKSLRLDVLESLKYIWKSNQRKVLKFPNLTTLSISYCDSLKHVFTSSMVGGLLQLQHLHVMFCKNMEVIVKTEEEDEVKEDMELFPCLKSLKLKGLESLKGFCSGKVNFSWPLLRTLRVPACPEITDMLLLQH